MDELRITFDGRSYSFSPGQPVRIGRGADSDVVVSDPTVSRQHAQLTWGPEGWLLESTGRSGTFVHGQPVSRLAVAEPVEVALASPQGPVLRIERLAALPPAATRGADSLFGPGTHGPDPAATPVPGFTPVPEFTPLPSATPVPAAPPLPDTGGVLGGPPAPPPPPAPGPIGPPGAVPPPGPPPTATAGPGAAPVPGGYGDRAAGPGFGPPGAHAAPPGHARPRGGQAAAGSRDELATALEILVPIKSWLTDPGWRRGIRLLVIPYALLPLVFLALFSSSGNLSTPGWAYSLYIAPLWAIAFWLLIRPGPLGKLELLTGVAIIAWVMIWMTIVTGPIDGHLNPKNFGDALGVGFNEEITKALPILLAAMLLLRWRSVKLDVRMWMFLGTIAGLTFGVREASLYTTVAIERIAVAAQVHSANLAVLGALSFAFRVFVDGFQHAIWAGVAAFFIGIAVNYPRRRVQLIVFGISIAAVLHALNDWIVSNVSSLWPWILLQALSLVLFLGYTISAASIERNVRRTPLFRGDSILMDKFSEPGEPGGTRAGSRG